MIDDDYYQKHICITCCEKEKCELENIKLISKFDTKEKVHICFCEKYKRKGR